MDVLKGGWIDEVSTLSKNVIRLIHLFVFYVGNMKKKTIKLFITDN